MPVSIKGIDKVKLLHALWNRARPAAFFVLSGHMSPGFDECAAKEAIRGTIDYYCGRCIKTDLSGDIADPSLYDRDWGEGSFQKIVKNLTA
jgi:hypothetical protein